MTDIRIEIDGEFVWRSTDWVNITYGEEAPAMLLSAYKVNALDLIDAHYEKEILDATGNPTEAERDTWPASMMGVIASELLTAVEFVEGGNAHKILTALASIPVGIEEVVTEKVEAWVALARMANAGRSIVRAAIMGAETEEDISLIANGYVSPNVISDGD